MHQEFTNSSLKFQLEIKVIDYLNNLNILLFLKNRVLQIVFYHI